MAIWKQENRKITRIRWMYAPDGRTVVPWDGDVAKNSWFDLSMTSDITRDGVKVKEWNEPFIGVPKALQNLPDGYTLEDALAALTSAIDQKAQMHLRAWEAQDSIFEAAKDGEIALPEIQLQRVTPPPPDPLKAAILEFQVLIRTYTHELAVFNSKVSKSDAAAKAAYQAVFDYYNAATPELQEALKPYLGTLGVVSTDIATAIGIAIP